MAVRVLIPAAGSGPSNNLIRSLRAGAPSLELIGYHADRFVLKKSPADRNYLIPPVSRPAFAAALRRLVEIEQIDLLIPSGDQDVALASRLRHELSCRVFLPRAELIDLCQDKYRLTVFLGERGLPVPLTYPVADLQDVADAFTKLPPASRLWCRTRSGADSRGATPVADAGQARSWISYWQEMRGVPASAFTLCEYLPGRDFACQSLWKDGRLVLIKTYERIDYFGGDSRPSGVASQSALARTVVDPRVVETSVGAIRALGDDVSGAFDVDLKEGADGVPRITEINAGRFISGASLFDFSGKHNMAATYVRLALDEPVEIADPYDAVEDHYMVRDLDTLPGIFSADELFEGIIELGA